MLRPPPWLPEALRKQVGVQFGSVVRLTPDIVVFGSFSGIDVAVKVSENSESLEREKLVANRLNELGIRTPFPIEGVPSRMQIAGGTLSVLVTPCIIDDPMRKRGPGYYGAVGRLLGKLQTTCRPLGGVFPISYRTAVIDDTELRARQRDLHSLLLSNAEPRNDCGVSHNDFHSGNILASDDGLVLIDLAQFGDGYLDSDVGNVLYELFYSPVRYRDSCRDAFLSAYRASANRSFNLEVLSSLSKLNDISELLIRTDRRSISNCETEALLRRIYSPSMPDEISWGLG